MAYKFDVIEKEWQDKWAKSKTYEVKENDKPKCYVLDMFPYPSGSGLHVGHPLGYISSDVYARYKRLKGFNVLHPMGFDAFGLPAEQYALEKGVHPESTTQENIETYTQQLKKIGLSYDWERQVNTSDPNYYKWTQWIFLQLFNSYFDVKQKKGLPIQNLILEFEQEGNLKHQDDFLSGNVEGEPIQFSAQEWCAMNDEQQQAILMNYRLAYQGYSPVNWCEALGTVLANDEVINGLSERGGHPVERRMMRQWFLRTTAYAERLLEDLNALDWSDALKEMQRNWIGKSEGASVYFPIKDHSKSIEVFTTRPDTLFGVTFVTLAPEHEWVQELTTPEQQEAVQTYVQTAKNRSDRERMADVKTISGVFTGSYVVHPITQQEIPIWIGDYVLVGYGTGAVMAVPSADTRDFAFAKHFNLPFIEVVSSDGASHSPLEEAYDAKEGLLLNSDFLNGLSISEAKSKMIQYLEQEGKGKGRINYKLRDAGFSRQRYWGEPFPIVYPEGKSYPVPVHTSQLPVILPKVEQYKPTGDGRSPLALVEDWVNLYDGNQRETDTMPGFAGSSWYFLRYMSPNCTSRFVDEKAESYWQNVDVYVGGTEHAVGHLLYARFTQKVLFDLGLVSQKEPFKKLVNQGMILGVSSLLYVDHESQKLISKSWIKEYPKALPIRIAIKLVKDNVLDCEAFRTHYPAYTSFDFLTEENGTFVCGSEVEKMSKRYGNVVNPDDVIAEYGADAFRLYEMFLGPIEQSKPWSTQGIEGTQRFLKKVWSLFYDAQDQFLVQDATPTAEEYKLLHKAIKKIEEELERYSMNTCVSTYMILVNGLLDLKCHKKAILKDLLVLLAPFTPHICEELWQQLGEESSIVYANYPTFNPEYLVENSFDYPVSFNGKVRFKLTFATDVAPALIEEQVKADEQTLKFTEGKAIKKIIVVPNRIINVVV